MPRTINTVRNGKPGSNYNILDEHSIQAVPRNDKLMHVFQVYFIVLIMNYE